jgi:hypothetical protein
LWVDAVHQTDLFLYGLVHCIDWAVTFFELILAVTVDPHHPLTIDGRKVRTKHAGPLEMIF